jgi:hypothetical protein
VLRPAISHASPPSYDELVGELGLESAQQAANLLVTAKRHFRRVLQSVVAEYVSSEAEIEDEISDLRSILAAGPHLPSPLVGERPHSGEFSRSGVRERTAVESNISMFLEDSDITLVANLFHLDADQDSVWEPLDLERLLRRLLNAPVAEALRGFSQIGTQSTTLAAVFTEPGPSLEMFTAIKEWSRRSTRAPEPPLPSDIASLLYFAAIAAAHLRHGQWISKLDPALLRQGIEMLLAKPWLGEPFRGLFQEFIARSYPTSP